MTAIERFHEYIKYKQLTRSKLEKTIGVSHGYFMKTLQRKSSIGSEILGKIFNLYEDLNPIWLIQGKGNMLNTDHQEENAVNETPAIYQKKEEESTIVKYLKDIIAEKDNENKDLIKQIAILEYKLSLQDQDKG